MTNIAHQNLKKIRIRKKIVNNFWSLEKISLKTLGAVGYIEYNIMSFISTQQANDDCIWMYVGI